MTKTMDYISDLQKAVKMLCDHIEAVENNYVPGRALKESKQLIEESRKLL